MIVTFTISIAMKIFQCITPSPITHHRMVSLSKHTSSVITLCYVIGKHERRIRLSFAFAGSKMQIFDFTRAISKCLDFDRTNERPLFQQIFALKNWQQTNFFHNASVRSLLVIHDSFCGDWPTNSEEIKIILERQNYVNTCPTFVPSKI